MISAMTRTSMSPMISIQKKIWIHVTEILNKAFELYALLFLITNLSLVSLTSQSNWVQTFVLYVLST